MSVDSKNSVRDRAQKPSGDLARSAASATESAAGLAQERRELLVIERGGHLLGVFMENVAGIAAGKSPAPLPRAPVSLLGVIAFRGRMLTVIDPLPLLGEPSRMTESAIVVALSGDEQLALAADSSHGAIEILSRDIELAKHRTESEIICGTLRREGVQIRIIDVARLFVATGQQHERRRRRF